MESPLEMDPDFQRLRLVILDRDGVINVESEAYIKSVDEFQLLPGSARAILNLKQAGFLVAIATNQSGIARGYYDENTLNAMHSKLDQELQKIGCHNGIDALRYCPHGPDDGCLCRKPRPGMLNDIVQDLHVSKSETIFVGDKVSDLRAAVAANVPFALVRTGHGPKAIADYADEIEARAVGIYASLADLVTNLVQSQDHSKAE